MKQFHMAGAFVVALAMVAPASAASINVLWYENSGAGYEAGINALSGDSVAHGGNSWNITYWNGSTALPAGSYNVLVVGSDVSFFQNYTGLHSFLTSHTLGDRIMVSGQDADFHFLDNSGSFAGTHAQTDFNSAQGFLVDAVNWAASGTGLGVVFEGVNLAANGLDTANAALAGLGSQSGEGGNENVIIPGAYASFPINAGLTTGGLSGWGNSYHYHWTGSNTSDWTPINTSGDFAGSYVTLVSAATADEPTTASPEPATLTMLGMGVASLCGFGWRKRKSTVVTA
jgi:hypothetical protein